MTDIDRIIVPEPEDGEVLQPQSWFDSPGPFELEIGSGKGGFLLSRAKSNPGRRFLGIEWANKYFQYAADRMARWGLTNVRMMRTDARYLVLNHMPPQSVRILHLYHPDPWPKARHHKRRLVQTDFVEAAVNLLEPEGLWLVQSDHAEYFEWMVEHLRVPTLERIDWPETEGAPGDDWEGTNFEIKFENRGFDIHRAAYRKR